MADDFNPYSAPQSTPKPVVVDEGTGLKSLGQEARKTSLNKARWIMIAIGVITIGFNLFQYMRLEDEIRKELRKLNLQANAEQMQEIKSEASITLYLFMGLGVAFVAMGICVYQFPVPITIAGLVLYILGQALTVYWSDDPKMAIISGWLIKLLFIVGLWQAIQAAKAYEQERRLSPYDGF